MNFQTDICPLCNQKLLKEIKRNYKRYYCQNGFDYLSMYVGPTQKTHYEVVTYKNGSTIQSAYTDRWVVDSTMNDEDPSIGESGIYRHEFASGGMSNDYWKSVAHVPIFFFNSEEELRKKIKLIITFL